MKSLSDLKRTTIVALISGCIGAISTDVGAVTQNYYGTTGVLSGSVWSTNPAGPYTSAFSTAGGGGVMNFDNAGTQAAGANSIVAAGISATQNFSLTGAPTGTLSNQGNLVIPVNVASGATLDFGSLAFTTSGTAGYNFTGPGTLALLGGAYGGGFTINSGTLIVRGVNAMGSNATNTLTINGGIIAGNANRDLSSKFGAGITVGGDFTLGASAGLASATATLTFNNNVNLGGIARTITIGNNAQHTFNTGTGVISNGGLIIDAVGGATGRILLLGQNSYAGGTTVKTGATLSANGISSTGVGPITSGPIGIGSLTLDGGTFIPSSGASNTIANPITLNNVSTNAINVSTTSGIGTTLSGDISGLGGFTKGTSGVLVLSGANNYSGPTTINAGTIGFAKKQSLYAGNSSNWTDSNLIVNSGGTAVLAVGGAGEFSLSEFLTLASVGSGTGGFKDGSNIGLDTTSGDQTISAVFTNNNGGSNKLGLVKSGVNTLFLTAANTHSGPTTVVGGTLNLSNLLALQNSVLVTSNLAGTVVFDQAAGGSTFTLGGLSGNGNLALQDSIGNPIALIIGNNSAAATTSTYSAILSGAAGASLRKVGAGIQVLSGVNTYDGGTTINAGTLAMNNASAIGTGPLTINSGAKLDNTTGANITLSTNNAQTWNGDFTFTGTRALSLGTGAVTMSNNITIDLPGTNATNNALTIAGPIAGPGLTLTKSGQGRMFLSGQSTFSGGVNIIGGVVHVSDQSSNLGSGTGPLGTGTLSISGGQLIGSSTNGGPTATIENAIVLTGGPDVNFITTNATLFLTGAISGTGGFSKTGNGPVILTSANTFGGDTTVTGSTLNLNHPLALQNSTLASGGVVFDQSVAGNAFTLGGLSGVGNVLLENNSGAAIQLTVGNNDGNTEHTGALTGLGGLVKTGAGTTKLAGANLYVGTTTVEEGTLLLNGTHSGGSDYTVNALATLGGIGSTAASVVVNANATIAPGASVGTFTVANADIDGKLKIEFGDNAIDKLAVNGTLDLTNTIVDFSALGNMANGEYIFATYGTLVGSGFANVLNLPGTLALNHDTTNKRFSLIGQFQATLPGDYNLNGVVDGADYVVWRNGGSPDSTQAGYSLWRAHFGELSGSGSGLGGGGAVPEPATCALLVLAAASVVCGPAGRRHSRS